jgi:hypothetical protein
MTVIARPQWVNTGKRSMLVSALIFLQLAAASPPPHSVDQVLAAVSRNVRDFQKRLPDFVCDERITSTTSESGTLRTIKIVESVFTAVQKTSPVLGNGQPAFTEAREITAINGKAVRKGTAMPKLPLAMFGGFSGLLSMTFSSENLEFHTYQLNKTLDEGRLVLKFATKDHQQKLRTFLNGNSLVAKDTGTAWIDATSIPGSAARTQFPSASTRSKPAEEHC